VAHDPNAPVAALDCGTNSTRLLIASNDGETLSRQMRITRLGQGVDATHRLNEEAIQRTLLVLADYKREMDELGVEEARLVATSAVRDAENGQVFLDAATQTVGVQAEMIAGLEEGRLSYAGATADLEPNAGDDVAIDIGGGSTEIVLKRGDSIDAVSLDIGCVRITERFLHSDPPKSHELASAGSAIGDALDQAVKEVPALGHLRDPRRLLGLAGTVSTLAMLELGITDYDRSRVHHAVLARDSVERWRNPRPGGDERPPPPACNLPGREDVIVGGVLVLEAAMRRFGFATCLVSEADILDGLVASLTP